MAMDPNILAKQLWALNGPVLDKDGKVVPPTQGIKDYCKGFVNMLKAGIVAHAPGTISGSAAPGGPLSGGKASGGKITALLPATWSAVAAKSNVAVAPKILLEATAVAAYIMSAALVSFTAGTITGKSTETTSPSPGPLATGAGKQGKITKLDGSACAKKVLAVVGTTGPNQVKHYTTMMNFVMTQAAVTYATGTVTGTCTGGQLTLGVGAGGKIA